MVGWVAATLVAGAAPPALHFDDRPESAEFGTIAVSGLPAARLAQLSTGLARADWERVLAVRLGGPEAPAMLGTYVVEGDTLRFRPRFPIAAGLSFEVRFEGSVFDELARHDVGGTPQLSATFRMPSPPDEALPHVVAVYPSAEELPENLLRVYVHFSAPVFPKHIHEHVHLYDAAGREVELPFVEVEGGLWDPDRTRLTLFLHPGRIKRDVAPNTELGPVLRAGETFRLAVDADLGGEARLAARHDKSIVALPADRTPPAPSSFELTAPRDREAALTLDFPEPLDHALLGRLIRVEDASGATLAGHVAISRDETRWTFTPDRPWAAGDYVVRIDPALEDLAGNSLAGAFERPEGAPPGGRHLPVEIPFRFPEAR